MRRVWSLMILCLLVALPILGCGGPEGVSGVEGVVTLDGKPVPDATVEFTPEGGGRPSTGRTDASGHYELAYTATEMGAKEGKHNVKITTGGMKEEAGKLVEVPETIPATYNTKTTLSAEVTSGKNTVNFDLKGK